MIVTISTDASFQRDHNLGSYAFWISSNEGRYQQYGVFKDPCLTPTIAETKCILNAIYYLATLKLPNITKLVINTDSLNSIYILKGMQFEIEKYKLRRHKQHIFKKRFDNMKKKYNIPEGLIEFRHVKAHTNTNDKRSYVNSWCDMMAKQVLTNHIQKIKHQQFLLTQTTN